MWDIEEVDGCSDCGSRLDVESLRHALIEDVGSAAFSGFPFAAGDAIAYEHADADELVEAALRQGWDMRSFEE